MSTQRQQTNQKERSKTMNMRHLLPAQRRERVRAKTIVLALGAAGLLAISAVMGMAAPASAAATVTRDTITTPIFETGLADDCRAGLSGTLVGTDVLSFQSVETAEGFHFSGTEGGPGRIDWSDGTYTIIESVDHLSFNAVGHGTTVFTSAHED